MGLPAVGAAGKGLAGRVASEYQGLLTMMKAGTSGRCICRGPGLSPGYDRGYRCLNRATEADI